MNQKDLVLQMKSKWWTDRFNKLPASVKSKVSKSVLGEIPLEKPIQPKDYDIWFHLLLDLFNCKDLDDHKVIEAFFSELIQKLGMKALTPIQIISVDNKEGRGTSAVQMITTSSITFHSDDKYYAAFIDIFSCKSYDPRDAVVLVKKYFDPKTINTKFLYRAEH